MSLILIQETASSVPTPPAGKGTIFLNGSDQLVTKDSTGNVAIVPTFTATNNTSVFYNNAGELGEDSSFTFDNTTDTVTVANLSVTGTLNAGDISVSSIANGTSNVDIVGVGGNVTISVGGNANIFTTTGTGANISGTLSASGNANVGNLGTGGLITATGNITGGNLKTTGLISATGNVTTSALVANGSVGNGVVAGASTSGTTQGTGVRGQAYVSASADTGAAVGVRGYAIDTHSGGYNIGVLGNASGSGVGNYAFYVQNGGIGSIEQNNVVWDLADNQTAALQFNSSGKANIFGIETTDGAEGVYTQGYLNVTGNTSTGGIKTDNYYYANGTPVDFQQAGGSNTQVQFNDNDGFGGSANFTFNKTTNVLSVNGNIIGANLNTAGVLSVSGNTNVGNLGTAGLITATGNVTAGNLVTGGAISATGNANVGNIGAAAGLFTTVAGSLTTASQPNVTSLGTLTSLGVNGTVTAVNITANTGVITGNANGISSVQAANIVGTTLSSTVVSSSLTAVGTLVSLTVSGNANIGNIGTAGLVTATGNVTTSAYLVGANLSVATNANVGNLGTSGLITATGNVTAGNLVTGGAISATGNANIGNIGTGGLITVTGNGTFGNISTGGLITATGNVTAGNLVTGGAISATGNANVGNLGTTNLVATGVGSFGANVNMNSKNINNLATPTADSDAATKLYVDGLVSTGLYYHAAVTAATTTTLAATTGGTITYNNGTNGVNANLVTTGSFNLIDTANVQTVGTRILVKNEANATWNGIYTWANSTTIVRATDADTYGTGAGDLSENDYFFVSGGNVNIGSAYVCNTAGVITFGTTDINFAMFSTSQVYSNGVGLNLSGTVFSLANTAVTAASYGGSDTVATFTVDAQGRLTAASNTVIQANAANLSGTTLKSTVVNSSLTSVGTLTSLSVSGNANVGNLGTGGLITATGNITSTTFLVGANLSITGNANVGNIGATNIVGTLTTASQTNITAVGTLDSLSVTANANIGNIGTGGLITATGNISGANLFSAVDVRAGGLFSAGGNVIGGNLTTTGLVTATGTITGGNLATAGTLSAGGNANVGNLGTGGLITVTGNVTAGNLVTGGELSVTGNANIGNIGTGGLITATGNITGGNIISTTNHLFSVATGVAAAGTIQGDATAITKDFNVVSTVASGAGVRLPVVAGLRMAIVNTSANALLVYPGTSGTINSLALNAAYSLPAGGKLDFISTTTTQWYTLNGTYA